MVGDKLMPAFNTSTGIPFSRVNLRTGWVKKNQPETCTACAGTLILEFAALSRNWFLSFFRCFESIREIVTFRGVNTFREINNFRGNQHFRGMNTFRGIRIL